ncbi:MAG: hypothetical protein KC502_17400 [Myxococcales bacterium]|nr:hypothetical protein [Myxococcales bacterium]
MSTTAERICKLLALGMLWSSVVMTGCASESQPALICHNSNCVEPPDPHADDTLDALTASLALELDGRPAVDGIETDIFWSGESKRCIFAHDLETGADGPDAIEAANTIGKWLEGRGTKPATRAAGTFTVFIELKGHVGLSKADKHTPEQRASHASCALDMVARLAAASEASGVPLAVRFTSFDPDLLQALVDEPRWTKKTAKGEVSVALGVILGIPPPLDGQSKPLSAFSADLPIDFALCHPHWLRDGNRVAIRSRGWRLAWWMFSAVAETYDAIDRYEPAYVVTSEGETLARWLAARAQ